MNYFIFYPEHSNCLTYEGGELFSHTELIDGDLYSVGDIKVTIGFKKVVAEAPEGTTKEAVRLAMVEAATTHNGKEYWDPTQESKNWRGLFEAGFTQKAKTAYIDTQKEIEKLSHNKGKSEVQMKLNKDIALNLVYSIKEFKTTASMMLALVARLFYLTTEEYESLQATL